LRWLLLAFTLIVFIGPRFCAALEPPASLPSSYLLRPGDRISITVMDESPLSTPEGGLEIPADGKISFYGFEFQAAGKTREQLRQDVIDQLKIYIKNPIVSVNLTFTPYNTVSINGAVNKPGEIAYRPGMTLLDLLANAGGLNGRADRTALIFKKEPDGSTKKLVANVQALLNGDLDQNYALDPGDIIQVNDATVYLDGQIRVPGSLSYVLADTASKAIALSGGVGPDADLHHAFIRRGEQHIDVDLSAVAGDDAKPDAPIIPLQPGDLLYIPPLRQKVTLIGDVKSSGFVYLIPKERDKLMDVFSSAGGPNASADLSKIFLRRVKSDNEQVELTLNVGPKGSLSDNVILQDGDIIYVPPLKEKDKTQTLFTTSLVLQLLGTLRNL
jgi:polysaccharide export outer membrane protein